MRTGRPFAVSEAAGLTVYRIVQEALTNTLKHAHTPASVEVSLGFDDPDISVRVADDGGDPVLADVSAGPATTKWGCHQRGRQQ